MTHRLFSGMGFGLRFCSALVDDAVSVMNVPVILWILVRSIFLKCWWLTRNEVEYLRIRSGTGYIRSQVRLLIGHGNVKITTRRKVRSRFGIKISTTSRKSTIK